MCGVAGVFAYAEGAPAVDREALLRVRDAMLARGPDGEGLWVSDDRRCGLAHRRLSLVDLSNAGAQPMASADGNLRITFNGEIYNYLELKRDLEGRGCVFRSSTDTEVLLHLYAQRGADMVHALRGMYAFAIYDVARRQLFLARDPFGIKPLYYSDDGRSFRFASQVKALLQGGGIDTSPDPAGHVGFYLWGTVPEPHTLYRGIRMMPAGATMLVQAGRRAVTSTFFDLPQEFLAANASAAERPQDAAATLHAAIQDSVRHHLIADVPVGVFLSSGIDSATIMAAATELVGSDVFTVTLGFREFKGTERDETPLAEMLAARYGTNHHTQWVLQNDFEQRLEHLRSAMDQPSIDGVNTYFVSRVTAELGLKAALSGVGGDELFGGYPSFRHVPKIVSVCRAAGIFARLGKSIRHVSAPFLKTLTSPKYAGLLEYGDSYAGAYMLRRALFMPWELLEFLDADFAAQGWAELQTIAALDRTIAGLSSPMQKVAALELSWYMRNQLLRDADWAGMAHSLEIRLPLVDVPVFRAVAPLMLDARASKAALAATPEKPLPSEIINKKKTGFVIPVSRWLQHVKPARPALRGLRAWAFEMNPPITGDNSRIGTIA
jgi:asparagine synthase (glutamine-hydrolysing)